MLYDSNLLKNIHIIENGCHIWGGYLNKDGYGVRSISTNGIPKKWLMHRLIWTETFGDIPDGLLVLHKCDTPACCNLEHLFIGNVKDNVADRVLKKRSGGFCTMYKLGESNPNAKLSNEQREYIKQSSASTRALATQLKVSPSTIARAKKSNY